MVVIRTGGAVRGMAREPPHMASTDDSDAFRMSVQNDARKTSFGGDIKDGLHGLHDKLEGEFMEERVSSSRKLEDKLRWEVDELADLVANLASDKEPSSVAKEAFDAKRSAALKLRSDLIVQREVSGLRINATATAEAGFPLPAEL